MHTTILRLLDIEQQTMYDAAWKICFLLYVSIQWRVQEMASSLSFMKNHEERRELPFRILTGRFKATPHETSLCYCAGNKVESLTHKLLHCNFYEDIHNIYIDPTLKKFPWCVEEEDLKHLLNGENKQCTIKTATYIKLAMQHCRTHSLHPYLA